MSLDVVALTEAEREALDYFLGWRRLSPEAMTLRLQARGLAVGTDMTVREVLDVVLSERKRERADAGV